MVCEKCLKIHDGSYGSGRFCSSKCARSFSTKNKRAEINKKVSEALKGTKSTGKPFKKGYDPRRKPFTDKDREKAQEVLAQKRLSNYKDSIFENLPLAEKRRVVFKQQEGKCAECGLSSWQNKPITLEFHHKNGNHNDNSEGNTCFLCPNCHSQTENFRNRNRL